MFHFCRGCQEDEENAVAERENQYPTGSQKLCLLFCLMSGCVGKNFAKSKTAYLLPQEFFCRSGLPGEEVKTFKVPFNTEIHE